MAQYPTDRAVKHEGPSLFEEYDEEARLSAAKELEKASKDVDAAAQKRRDETVQQSKGRGKRPEKYNTYGLPETVTTVYPEGVDIEQYDVIGQDETRVLHLEPHRLWVETIITPVLRRKTDKNNPSPDIRQAPRPHSIIGGGYVGADLLATLINNKFNLDASPHSRGTYFYYYKGSRAGETPRTQLRGFQGAIQNDGYNVYKQFENLPGITTLACMAHIRRKFIEAQTSTPPRPQKP